MQNLQGQLSSDIQDTELKKAKVDLAEQQLEEKQNQVSWLVAVAEEKVAVAGTYKLLMFSMRLCKIQMGTNMADSHIWLSFNSKQLPSIVNPLPLVNIYVLFYQNKIPYYNLPIYLFIY